MRISVTKKMEAELQAIYRANGYLDEALVVKASRRKASALHSLFFWGDDKAAAEVGRLEIARMVIVRVHIEDVELPDTNKRVSVRAYMGVGDGYRSAHDVLGSDDLTAIVLARALDDLRRFKAKYGHLRALQGLTAAIDDAIRRNGGTV